MSAVICSFIIFFVALSFKGCGNGNSNSSNNNKNTANPTASQLSGYTYSQSPNVLDVDNTIDSKFKDFQDFKRKDCDKFSASFSTKAVWNMIKQSPKPTVDGKFCGTLNLFIFCGADLKAESPDGLKNSILHQAISSEFGVDVLKILIDGKANVNAENFMKKTPVMIAAEKGAVEVVQLLLSNHVDLSTETDAKMNVLSFAAKFGKLECVKLLFNQKGFTKKVDINTENSKTSPLCLAIQNGHVEVAKFLIDSKVDLDREVEKTEENGSIKKFSPLMSAIELGDQGLVEYLLKHNASPDYKNNKNETPLDVAKAKGSAAIVQLLSSKISV